MVREKTSQYNYSQEADARYTKLTKLRCNDTQLPRGEAATTAKLLCHAVTEKINATTRDKYTNLSMEHR